MVRDVDCTFTHVSSNILIIDHRQIKTSFHINVILQQYPKNIGEANNMLNLHLESKKSEAKAPLFTQISKKGSDRKSKKERAYYVCGDKSHVAPNCPDKMRMRKMTKATALIMIMIVLLVPVVLVVMMNRMMIFPHQRPSTKM